MRVLVTGASGLLGGRLAQLLSSQTEVIAAHHHSPVPPSLVSVHLDVEEAASVEAAIENARPDAVLHAAAFATPEACERDSDRANRVNALGSATMAEVCARRNIRLVALSTDLVLGGLRSFSDEEETASPVMVYGRTKLLGEGAVLAAPARFAVARVPLILGRGFGPRGSATESIAWSLRGGARPALFVDEYRTPTDAESLLPALLALLHGTQTGRFHLGGPERLSRHDLGLRVARVLGLPADWIEAIRQSDRPTLAPRPPDVSLDSGRALRELGFRPRGLEEAIREGRSSASG